MIILQLTAAYLSIGLIVGFVAVIYTWFTTEPAKRPLIPWGFGILADILKDLLFWPATLLSLGGVCLLRIQQIFKNYSRP